MLGLSEILIIFLSPIIGILFLGCLCALIYCILTCFGALICCILSPIINIFSNTEDNECIENNEHTQQLKKLYKCEAGSINFEFDNIGNYSLKLVISHPIIIENNSNYYSVAFCSQTDNIITKKPTNTEMFCNNKVGNLKYQKSTFLFTYKEIEKIANSYVMNIDCMGISEHRIKLPSTFKNDIKKLCTD